MATPYDPWTPGPVEGLVPDQGVAAQVGSFMEDPRARAALLSFGLQMMQPPSFGDNFASQFGRAVGAGGEAVARTELQNMKETELGIKQQEAESKQDLRGAQAEAAIARAGAAEARAGAAGERLNTAGARLALQQQEAERRNERSLLQNRIRISNMYQKYVQDVQERNSDILRPRSQPPEPILGMEEWIARNPVLKDMGLVPAGSSEVIPQPQTGPQPSARPSSAPVPTPSTTAAPTTAKDPYEGRTITNPTTGEKRIRRNGQWEPL